MYEEMATAKRTRVDVDEADEEADEGRALEREADTLGVVERLLPLVEKWLPVVLGKGPKSAFAVEAIKALPEYRQLIRNQEALGQLVSYVEKKYGRAEVARALKRLGAKMPG